jgi:hypothetical protein
MLRAVRPEASIDTVDALKLYCDVGCEAGSPSRPAGGFDTMALTRTLADGARAVQNSYPLKVQPRYGAQSPQRSTN